ncbi:MAG: hypothetical protein VXZ22_00500 [Bacteroidota bacterium]|nr:hypothetical protein [Bacteroidota bacterium]
MRKSIVYYPYITILLLYVPKLNAQLASVKVEQDSTITKLMATKIEIDFQDYASTFYTIQLFYGDNKLAQELFENFKQSFPDWEITLSFETPNYKVQVGRFKDYYFGQKKLKEIKKVYPEAFLLKIKN